MARMATNPNNPTLQRKEGGAEEEFAIPNGELTLMAELFTADEQS
jgi:hypothetical protein